jgi:AraC-like DNA-binding protein
MADRDWTVCVRLHPGALFDLTGLSAAELTDRSVPLRAFTGTGTPLLDELEDTHAPADAARIVMRLLDAQLRGSDASTVRAAPLLRVLRTAPAHPLRDVAAELGLAPRTLHHVAVTAVGLSPRRITRILRLHGALFAAIAGAGNWARIAAASGYADQSHLVREFRALLGEAPGAFMRRGWTT